MGRRLLKELQQTKPFEELSEEVFLEIFRTAEVAGRWMNEELKPFGLGASTFNVLRILRGSHPKALSASRIAERMVNHDPDLTRLIDRLEKAGLVTKARDAHDRRVVNIAITEQGLTRVAEASARGIARLKQEMSHLKPSQMEMLADLLELVRAKPDREG